MDLTVIENKERKRFETNIDGKIAFIDYIRAKDKVIYLTHTEVPQSLEGREIGSKLVIDVLQIIEEEGASLAPLCPFIAGFVREHPEWKKLLAPGYNV